MHSGQVQLHVVIYDSYSPYLSLRKQMQITDHAETAYNIVVQTLSDYCPRFVLVSNDKSASVWGRSLSRILTLRRHEKAINTVSYCCFSSVWSIQHATSEKWLFQPCLQLPLASYISVTYVLARWCGSGSL